MTRSVFTKTLVRDDHSRSYEVACVPGLGWQVSEVVDHHVVKQCDYSDWHYVERMVTRFRRDISELERQGWVEA